MTRVPMRSLLVADATAAKAGIGASCGRNGLATKWSRRRKVAYPRSSARWPSSSSCFPDVALSPSTPNLKRRLSMFMSRPLPPELGRVLEDRPVSTAGGASRRHLINTEAPSGVARTARAAGQGGLRPSQSGVQLSRFLWSASRTPYSPASALRLVRSGWTSQHQAHNAIKATDGPGRGRPRVDHVHHQDDSARHCHPQSNRAGDPYRFDRRTRISLVPVRRSTLCCAAGAMKQMDAMAALISDTNRTCCSNLSTFWKPLAREG